MTAITIGASRLIGMFRDDLSSKQEGDSQARDAAFDGECCPPCPTMEDHPAGFSFQGLKASDAVLASPETPQVGTTKHHAFQACPITATEELDHTRIGSCMMLNMLSSGLLSSGW